MPLLRKIEDLKLGDMICIGNRIYKLDDDSGLQMCHGKKGKPEIHASVDYDCYFNDDGRQASCSLIAFERLGIDIEPLRAYQLAHGENACVPHEIVYRCLRENGFGEMKVMGRVGDILTEFMKMPGKFLVISVADQDDFSFHSIAVVDGVAYNLSFLSLADQALSLWHRRSTSGSTDPGTAYS
jgi:hypothetical protein